MEYKRGTLCSCWKLREGNVVMSLNRMEVEPCADGLSHSHPPRNE